jgi:hypothetical protein
MTPPIPLMSERRAAPVVALVCSPLSSPSAEQHNARMAVLFGPSFELAHCYRSNGDIL